MKTKKLKKLISDAMNKANENSGKYYAEKVAIEDNNNNMLFTESDEEVKKKTRNLIIRLLEHRDEIQFNCSETSMNLHSEIHKSTSTSNKFNTSYFHLEIIKGVGFIFNCNEKKILLKDELLYDDIKPKIKDIFGKINLNNFDKMYLSIMKDTGMARESNLDELLSDVFT